MTYSTQWRGLATAAFGLLCMMAMATANAQSASGTYDTNYGIRIVDANTIEAFKPDQPNNPGTRLVRIGGGMVSSGGEVDSAASDRYGAMAEHYAGLIETDPANVQAWTACSAVALKRSMSNPGEADAYAAQMVAMLQLMDVSSSPCPDAIPQW